MWLVFPKGSLHLANGMIKLSKSIAKAATLGGVTEGRSGEVRNMDVIPGEIKEEFNIGGYTALYEV